MNVWSFIGHLGRDAEARFLPDGTAVVSFPVAVKSGFGKSESTVWPKCTIFGKRGESLSQYLIKGTQVGVTGEVSNREWEDKQGNKRLSLEVRVNDVTLIGGRKDSAPEQQRDPAQRAGAPSASTFDDMDDDIPF